MAGKFFPIVRGKANPVVTGFVEMFPAFAPSGKLEWMTIPGASRFLGPDDAWLLNEDGKIRATS